MFSKISEEDPTAGAVIALMEQAGARSRRGDRQQQEWHSGRSEQVHGSRDNGQRGLVKVSSGEVQANKDAYGLVLNGRASVATSGNSLGPPMHSWHLKHALKPRRGLAAGIE